MSIAIDILLLLIFFTAILVGAKKGILNSLKNFISIIIGLVTSTTYCNKLATILDKKMVCSYVIRIIEKSFNKIGVTELNISEYLNKRPTAFINKLESYGINIDIFNSKNIDNDSDIFNVIIKKISQPISLKICKIVSFIIILLVTTIVIRLILKIIIKTLDKTKISKIDKFFGIIFGTICGYLICLITANIFNYSLPSLVKLFPDYFQNNIIENTIILKNILIINPLEWLQNLFI